MNNRNAAIIVCVLTITGLVGSAAAGFTEKQRRSIWEERVQAERRARGDAGAVYPLRHSLVDTLSVGTVVRLVDTTYLMPEYNPKEVWAAMAKQRTVLPGATGRVINFAVDNGGFLWYETEISESPSLSDGTADTGWVIASALMHQIHTENLWKNLDLEDSLRQVYIQELLHKYDIDKLQLDSISWEAEREQWPLPEIE